MHVKILRVSLCDKSLGSLSERIFTHNVVVSVISDLPLMSFSPQWPFFFLPGGDSFKVEWFVRFIDWFIVSTTYFLFHCYDVCKYKTFLGLKREICPFFIQNKRSGEQEKKNTSTARWSYSVITATKLDQNNSLCLNIFFLIASGVLFQIQTYASVCVER